MFAGPLWTGQLFDGALTKKMRSLAHEHERYLDLCVDESLSDVVGFLDLHAFAKKRKEDVITKTADAITLLQNAGFTAYRTHVTAYGIKTNAKIKEIIPLFDEHRLLQQN